MEIRTTFNKVFMWMGIGLLISFITAYYVSLNPLMLFNIFGKFYWGLFIIELVLVWVLASRTHKMNITTARVMFILYSFLSGLTLSYIFVLYEMSSIILIFGIAALVFGLFALLGYKTKVDLSKFRTILFMGLLAIIIVTIVNAFMKSEMVDYIASWVGIGLFVGITAYDIQKIKYLATTIDEDRVGIIGALDLYLDFINIFIKLISLFGKRK